MRIPGSLFLRNLVERRSLLFHLVRRDFEQRFIGSAMGWIWGLIHPLVLLLSSTNLEWAKIMIQRSFIVGGLMGMTNGFFAGLTITYFIRRQQSKVALG